MENPTVTVKTEATADVIERDAHNMFVAAKMSYDRDQVASKIEARFHELLNEAGMPVPTEDETIKKLTDQYYDNLRIERCKYLAEKAAKERFFEEHPELVNKEGAK